MKPVATHFHRNLAPKEGKLSMLKNVNFCPSVLDDFMSSRGSPEASFSGRSIC
ncbi:unnamed protein product [Linum tenue]|uniref:Uncharacterized protein n=1 Tax=Linum tenue TaxID=586396 RepID=A0AAV0IVB6_9ROSI|nr:unnamed protein product [Linum tenue]